MKVIGAWTEGVLKAKDEALLVSAPYEFVPAMDITGGGASRFAVRARAKAARWAAERVSMQTRIQLGYCYPELRRAAFEWPADLYIAHSEPAMAVAVDLLNSGRRVGVDFEDWFSEDLLPEARVGRPLRLLRSLETGLLTRGAYASCPSSAMSAALAREHGCSPPSVIYNAFAWQDRSTIDGLGRDKKRTDIPSVHWFSQTLGLSRGLEDLVGALPDVACDLEVHLRGIPSADFNTWLSSSVPFNLRNRIFVHPLVSNDELLSRVAEHDIGFAGEMKYCRSRDLTVTNKILYYLLGGLAVVASDTSGQREVARQAPEAVSIYRSGDTHELANCLNALLRSSQRLSQARAASLQVAKSTFCWERQETVMLDAIECALDRST